MQSGAYTLIYIFQKFKRRKFGLPLSACSKRLSSYTWQLKKKKFTLKYKQIKLKQVIYVNKKRLFASEL